MDIFHLIDPSLAVTGSIVFVTCLGVGATVGRLSRFYEERQRAQKAEAELARIRARKSAAVAKGNRSRAEKRRQEARDRIDESLRELQNDGQMELPIA